MNVTPIRPAWSEADVATAHTTLGTLERWVPSEREPDTYAHRAANQRQLRAWLIANATRVPKVIR